MGNKETERAEKVQAVVNGVIVSVIDFAVGQPVGAAVLAVARVTLRTRRPQAKEPAKLAAKV